jgi:flagellar biosynthesis protein FlhB
MAQQQDNETDKTQEATPFKLEQARKKGQVARGADIGFFAILLGLAFFVQLLGADILAALAQSIRHSFVTLVASAPDQAATLSQSASILEMGLRPLIGIGVIVSLLVILANIVQMRGLVFSTHPLKPDYNRLNPAQGMKRLFSLQMAKEAAKNIFKVAVYGGAAYILLQSVMKQFGSQAASGSTLARAMQGAALQLLIVFLILAAAFAILDQILVRQQFAKQMRMSARELKREYREREGEPRQKQKRKQVHAEYVKQQRQVSQIAGADVLIVNPEHYAVALLYTPATMSAPQIRAKGRNAFALQMRAEARKHNVTIIENAPVARLLYKDGRVALPIPEASFSIVADIYLMLKRDQDATETSDAV